MSGTDVRLSAKFSLPVLSDAVYPRERLFSLIGAAHGRDAVVWVDGPAGAGKTTLGASLARQERLPAIWYRVDAADSEPGVFFAELTQLAGHGRKAPELPVYDARLAVDPRRFAHRFFRAFFARLPAGRLLVFDDYHEIAADSPLHEVFGALLAEHGSRHRVLVLSRGAPPPALMQAIPSGRLTRLGWEALRLDQKETGKIAELLLPKGTATRPVAATLNRRVQGWAAGLILLIQQAAAGGLAADVAEQPTPDTVGDFFAAEIVRRSRTDDLSVLEGLALLPLFTLEMAQQFLPAAGAEGLLERLYRQNFFLSRDGAVQPVYRFHPLLREHLLKRLAVHAAPKELGALQMRAAAVLESAGYLPDALELYLQACAWRESEALFMRLVEDLARVGAYRTMNSYLSRFPDEVLPASPWLLYWRGLSRWTNDAPAGRADLNRAFGHFGEQGDDIGRVFAWCSLVECLVLEWGDLHPLDALIEAYDGLAAGLAMAPQAMRERATLALFTAHVYRRPQAAGTMQLVDAAHALFVRAEDQLVRVLAGNHLTFYYAFMQGDLARAAAYVEDIEGAGGEAEPVTRIVSQGMRGVMALWLHGDVEQANQCARDGIEYAADAGVHFWDFMLNAIGAWTSISSADYAQAAAYLEALGRDLRPESLSNRCMFHDTQAILHLHLGQIALADHHSNLSLELARQGGMPYAETACLLTRLRLKSLQQAYDEAEVLRAEAERIAAAMNNNAFVYYHLRVFDAAERLARDGAQNPQTRQSVRAALSTAVEGQFHGNLWLDQDTLANLYRLGLSMQVETAYLHKVISRYALRAGAQAWALDGWPFPVRIGVLAGLAVERLAASGYESVSLSGRAAQLLEALVWSGGERVDQQYLTDLLWPDAEGDAARRNFDTTLHRLRRQLGDDRLLLLADGRLSLDTSLCASDVSALRQLMSELDAALKGAADAPRLRSLQDALFRQSAGLRQDGSSEAFLPLRARLMVELRQRLERLAAHWLRTAQKEQASIVLEEIIALDPLAESTYEQLMQTYLERRKPGEALAVYARCREALEQLLGTRPGEALEALHRQVRGVST